MSPLANQLNITDLTRQNFVMRIVEDKDGDKFLVFDDFEELKEIFIEACHELEYENSDKNLSLDK